MAVLDSAYGEEPRSPWQMGEDFLNAVEPYVSQKKAVLFPVPKYGRGQEMLLLLQERWPQIPFYGDGHFQRQAQSLSTDEAWTLPQARQALAAVQVRPLGITRQNPAFALSAIPSCAGANWRKWENDSLTAEVSSSQVPWSRDLPLGS